MGNTYTHTYLISRPQEAFQWDKKDPNFKNLSPLYFMVTVQTWK